MPGGGGSNTTVQKSESGPPAFVRPFSMELLNRAEAQSRTFPGQQAPSGAEQVVGFTPEEQAAFQLQRERAFAPSPFGPARGLAALGVSGIPGGGLARFATGDPGFDPVTNRLVQRSQGDLLDQFNLNVAPSTAARFQRGGIFGGTAQQELESAQRFSLARALGDVEAGIRGDAVNRALQAEELFGQRALQGAGLFGQLAGQEEDLFNRRIAGLQGAGAQQRGLAQQIRDIDVANFLEQRNLPLRRLDILGSAINTAGGGFASQTGSSTGPGPNNDAAGLGAVISALGLMAMAASSKDFKHDDGPPERILDRVKQLPVRTWKYKGDDTMHIGPYAEDVLNLLGLGNGRFLFIPDMIGVAFQAIKDLALEVDGLKEVVYGH